MMTVFKLEQPLNAPTFKQTILFKSTSLKDLQSKNTFDLSVFKESGSLIAFKALHPAKEESLKLLTFGNVISVKLLQLEKPPYMIYTTLLVFIDFRLLHPLKAIEPIVSVSSLTDKEFILLSNCLINIL